MYYQILFLPKDIEAYNSKSYKVLAQHLKVFSQLLFQLKKLPVKVKVSSDSLILGVGLIPQVHTFYNF